MVLETAVNGSAELLVTSNRKHFALAERQFQIEIVSPAEALVKLGVIHGKE